MNIIEEKITEIYELSFCDDYDEKVFAYQSSVNLLDINGNKIGNLFFDSYSNSYNSIHDNDVIEASKKFASMIGLQKITRPTGQVFKLKMEYN